MNIQTFLQLGPTKTQAPGYKKTKAMPYEQFTVDNTIGSKKFVRNFFLTIWACSPNVCFTESPSEFSKNYLLHFKKIMGRN